MNDTLSRRADELAILAGLLRSSVALADSAIPPINEQLAELAAMGVDDVEIEGPLVFARAASNSPAFDDARIVWAVALVAPHGLGGTLWDADDHAARYGDSNCEPPHLRPRFVPFERCPPIVRAMLPAHAPKLIAQLLQSFTVLTQ
jgi:hypothetical protein